MNPELCLTCAGDEPQRVIAWLHVLPEVGVGVVEDVSMGRQVVRGLRGQHHPNIITCTCPHLLLPTLRS